MDMPILKPIRQLVEGLLGVDCTRKLFIEFDLHHGGCNRLLISKGLSIGILLGGLLVKVPQILKVVLHQSGEGLSMMGLFLETVAYAISVAYNLRRAYPFTTFGESCFILTQNILLFSLLVYLGTPYKHLRKSMAFLSCVVLGSGAYALYALPGIPFLAQLQSLTIALVIASRVPQIYANFSAKSTGQLSFLTLILLFGGSMARIFTTWSEVKDPLLLSSFLIACSLNGILALQCVLYWNPSTSPAKKKAD